MIKVLIVGATIFFIVLQVWFFVRRELCNEVEEIMRIGGAYEIKRGRALLAVRGHKLDKRTRDALTIWLAGQDDSK